MAGVAWTNWFSSSVTIPTTLPPFRSGPPELPSSMAPVRIRSRPSRPLIVALLSAQAPPPTGKPIVMTSSPAWSKIVGSIGSVNKSEGRFCLALTVISANPRESPPSILRTCAFSEECSPEKNSTCGSGSPSTTWEAVRMWAPSASSLKIKPVPVRRLPSTVAVILTTAALYWSSTSAQVSPTPIEFARNRTMT